MIHARTGERRCSGCGQPRPMLSGGYCLMCVGGAHEERERIKALIDYVRDHPGISVADASRALEISPGRICELIAAGRLSSGGGEAAC